MRNSFEFVAPLKFSKILLLNFKYYRQIYCTFDNYNKWSGEREKEKYLVHEIIDTKLITPYGQKRDDAVIMFNYLGMPKA